MMSQKISQEALMELLDSNINESEKIELVRQYRSEQSNEIVAETAKIVYSAFRRMFNQVASQRPVQQLLSTLLMRVKH